MKDDVDEDDSGTSSSGSTSVPESTIAYGNPRASRNMAEKQRRDNLNANISTMATLVPSVAGSSRRMDKISILRLATAFLRTRYTLGSGSMNFLPSQFNDQFDLEQFFVDHLIDSGGFFLIVTATGKIVYVSRQVEQHLGHVQVSFPHHFPHHVMRRMISINVTEDRNFIFFFELFILINCLKIADILPLGKNVF
ncbi:aryl hydrocarbon receptor nuclear translocator-like protein 1 isoform X2 [Pogonomyrmex barbatus]|uniref:Aryl hydrocarbon receptor Nuclear translocator-like protein 1 isoform X2 n=1 Tax=Pogonomyrmex barbatus TaxID=144034 RepID=A0A6I9VUN8_9HYME|nr:aryl hydrocarbon receptor nuclear translocator-like protein 1 isoform X2 [Pogonomyrmex barbatus]XP_011631777.1 aryl hydrocarbon receptor nuclear translocator-like protein 1 isoform X2 [Pogonomyrmex barbatus]